VPPLTPNQRAAVEYVPAPPAPLAVLGGAGTGKTTVLVERFAWLAGSGVAPESILVLVHDAAALRAAIEARLDRGFEELHVVTVPAFCARLLHDEAIEAGLGPFVAGAGAADRLAILLERVDELSVRLHDFRGSPAAMLAGIVARIDRLKELAVSAQDYAAWAGELADGEAQTDREREFAQIYLAHDRMLGEQSLLDEGEMVLRARELLAAKAHVRERTLARLRHVLVDDLGDLTPAQVELLGLLGENVTATMATAADAERMAGAPALVQLDRSFRSRERVLAAAGAVVGEPEPAGAPGGDVRFWRCANERAQAQSVAAEVARLLREGTAPGEIAVLVRSVRNEGQTVAVALEERAVPHRLVGDSAFFQRAEVRDVLAWLRLLVDPADAGAAVRALARPPIELRSVDLARCIQIARRRKLDMVGALVAATESPQLPPEARDRILAFLKLQRAAAGALDSTRPDLFVHRLIERLGLRRQQLFSAKADVVERLRNLSRLGELATSYVRRSPQATPREFARYISAVAEAGLRDDEAASEDAPRDAVAVMSMQAARAREFDHVFVLGLQSARMPGARSRLVEPLPAALLARAGSLESTRDAHVSEMRGLLHVAMTRARDGLVLAFAAHGESGELQPPSPFAEASREALGADWEDREEELFGPAESLHATYQALRDELVAGIPRTGSRLGELRLDTDLDVAHGTVRYLELLKVSALLARVGGEGVESIAEALPGINAAILQAATAQQREILESSPLDEALLDAERDARARAAAVAARDEPSLEAFLPRRGDGLLLSASDIDTYRTCPLKYKFARVFRIPSEPTLNQRFGILVHQVLERYHQAATPNADEMMGLLDAGWRRGGFGGSEEERQLRGKADTALRRYHERFAGDDAEPVWFERGFQFRMGRHTLRGRVDRVDKLPDGGFELIDYKTGRPKTAAQLREDVQLSLYAVGAREAWDLDASRQSYLYVLDDEKVPVPHEDIDRDWIADTVGEVADGISSQGFEPTPSYAACSWCDYRIACPAAER
jgi:DNA helicase II / ATP-dependent DNA helicase PcrA